MPVLTLTVAYNHPPLLASALAPNLRPASRSKRCCDRGSRSRSKAWHCPALVHLRKILGTISSIDAGVTGTVYHAQGGLAPVFELPRHGQGALIMPASGS